jgi:uncharacterized repeat protein (TIGR02543 family)
LVSIGILFLCPFATTNNMASLTVTNSSNEVNGNTSSPDALISDPGPDGISLREAILAVNSVAGPHTITFDPSLTGATITAPDGLPPLIRDGLTINGDIDGDGNPDITLNGAQGTAHDCFLIRASDITITGFTILDFNWTGFSVAALSDEGAQRIERVTLLGNSITAGWTGIEIATGGSDRTIKNVDVLRNRLVNNGSVGICINAASGLPTNSNNRITNIAIRDNVISNNGFTIAIFATGATQPEAMGNVISDLEISDNTIQGHTNTSILITGGNESKDQGNRVENLFIRNNSIQGQPVGIEVVGGVGEDATENYVSHATIEGNLLEQEGIMLVGGSMSGHHNGVDDFFISRNVFLRSSFQAFMIQGGSFDARNNTVEKITIVNNLIARSSGSGVLLLGGFDNSDDNVVKDVMILNNTLAENGDASSPWAGGINIENNNTSSGNVVYGVTIANTILWNNQQNDRIAGPQTPDSVQNSILGDARYRGSSGNFYASPQFVDPTQTDYSLQATSPAIDKGATSGADPGKFDLAGYPRVRDGNGDGTAVADIGAYETMGGGVLFRKLTIAADTHGRTDPGTGVVYVQDGTQITMSAVPKNGYEFLNWSGAISSTQNPVTIMMNGDKTIKANFGVITLTISAGAGGTTNPVPGTYYYPKGTNVTVTAVPNATYAFSGWSGDASGTTNPITITLDSSKSVIANFVRNPSLAISAGTGGTTDPVPGTYYYPKGTNVTVTAVPNATYTFSGWSGDVSGTTNPITITLDSNKSVTANFLKNIYAPQNFTGSKKVDRSLFLARYIIILTWQANADNASIEKYRIYLIDGETRTLLAEVNSTVFEYKHTNVGKDTLYTYACAAVNNQGREGDSATVTVK